jgi:hypothetical protein
MEVPSTTNFSPICCPIKIFNNFPFTQYSTNTQWWNNTLSSSRSISTVFFYHDAGVYVSNSMIFCGNKRQEMMSYANCTATMFHTGSLHSVTTITTMQLIYVNACVFNTEHCVYLQYPEPLCAKFIFVVCSLQDSYMYMVFVL